MITYKVTMVLKLHEDSQTDWIEQAIEEQLAIGEVIIDGDIEQVKHD
jgi:hypothetical protein